MAVTMLDKPAGTSTKAAMAGRDQAPNSSARARIPIRASAPHCCRRTTRSAYGSSASRPGERVGFHRHVLDYFWTSVSGGRGRQHLMDGTTVELLYKPGETRHETYGPGEYKVHDLTNLGDKEMVFMTVEFLNSANKPMQIPDSVAHRWRPPHSAIRETCGCIPEAANGGYPGPTGFWAENLVVAIPRHLHECRGTWIPALALRARPG